MSHTFPKQRLIDDVFFGLGQPVLSDVLLDSQYCNHDLAPYAFSSERAKALLTEAGWTDSDGDGLLDQTIDGTKVTFSFEIKMIANSPEWEAALTVYKNELRKLGIEAKPTAYEWKELVRVYEDKDFDAVVGGWQMDWDIDYFQLWHSSQISVQGSSNHCGFANPQVDPLADKLRITFDTSERVAIAKEIQQIIHDEQPYTFFKSGVGIFMWQNQPPSGTAVPPERYLGGVIKGLDSFHPLQNRTQSYWHFRN
jgi:peptide/nickel transport system substrate-binding protein